MTMQVGMVGTDGIVLASDTKWHRTPLIAGQLARLEYDAPKIRVSDTGFVAVTCARDMVVANQIAEALFTDFGNDIEHHRERRIREIGVAIAGDHDTECLIAFASPIPTLYLFQSVNRGVEVVSTEILTHACTGDTTNSAVFWPTRYYKKIPVHQLIGLASHLIVVAGELNTAGIGGLDIVVSESAGFRRFGNDEICEWEEKAREWDRQIGKFLLDGKELPGVSA